MCHLAISQARWPQCVGVWHLRGWAAELTNDILHALFHLESVALPEIGQIGNSNDAKAASERSNAKRVIPN